MYHALWRDWYLPAALPALEKLFFSQVPAKARVLDLCCGSGHVTTELVRRGYLVTGIDSSVELIALAKKDLQGVDLRVQDARELHLEGPYDAAISTFDSLNHILSLDELTEVFCGVHRLLSPNGGMLVFDMNLEQAYSTDHRRWTVDLSDDSVSLIRGTYNVETKKASTELIWFVKSPTSDVWKQHRSMVEQRCYTKTQIVSALRNASFMNVEAVAAMDAGVGADLGFGRIFFVVRR